MAKQRVGGRGRATPPKRRHSGAHLLPTDIAMHRELIDGQDCINVQFEQPNVTVNIPLALSGWRQFCEDIETLIAKGKPTERKREDTTGTGLVLPSSEDSEEYGGVPRLRR